MANINLGGSIGVPGSVAVLGATPVNFPSDANITLTAAQWSNQFLSVTSSGNLTATRNVIAPLNEGQLFVVQNGTFGGQSIQIIGATGSGVTILNGTTALVTCNASGNYVFPTTGSGIASLSGDVTGPSSSTTVVALQGNPVFAETLGSSEDGYALIWNADGYWLATPTASGITFAGDLSGSSTSQTVVKIEGNPVLAQSLGSSQDGYIMTWHNAGPYWEALPAPSGFTAGGDLSGSSTSQTVVGIDGKPIVITSLVSGDLLYYNGTDYVNSKLVGDVIGSPAANTVVQLQGYAVSNTGPTSGYVLTWTGTAWTPEGNNPILSGDVTGNAQSNTVVGLDTTPLVITTLTSNQTLIYNGTDWVNALIVNSNISSSAAVAVSKLAAGTSAQLLLNNSTPTPTWTSLSGDVSLSSSGASTVLAIHGTTVPATPSANQVLQATGSSAAAWVSPTALGAVSWADDLSGNSTSTSTAQYVSSLSFSSSSAGGAIAINGTGTSLVFAAGNTAPSISQSNNSTNSATGSSLTLQAQNATGTNSIGGNLYLESGTGTAQDGYIWLQCGSTPILELETAILGDGYVTTQIARFKGQESVFASGTGAPIFCLSWTGNTTDGYEHNTIQFTPSTNSNSVWQVGCIARDENNGNDFSVQLAIFNLRNISGTLSLNPVSPAEVSMLPSAGYGSCALSASISGSQLIIQVNGYGASSSINWNVFAQVCQIS
jgi:hypothetical protein